MSIVKRIKEIQELPSFEKFVTEVLIFPGSQYFFQLDVVFIADGRTDFFFPTTFSKTRVKAVLSPILSFLITYTSGSNRYASISWEFYEISLNTFFIEPLRRLLLHNPNFFYCHTMTFFTFSKTM